MRAPRHPQSCALTEAAMDDLAEKLGMDPIEFRLKNLEPDRLPYQDLPGRGRDGGRADRLAREAQAARPDRHRADPLGDGRGPAPVGRRRRSRAIGSSAPSTRTARSSSRPPPRTSAPASARSWRSSPPRSSGSSRPTSSATSAIRTFPPGQASGGSTTSPSMSPPCYDAVTKARDALFKKIAGTLNNAKPEDLTLKDGQVWVSGEPVASWKDACRKLGTSSISETGSFVRGPHQHRRGRLPVRRGRRSTSRPAWSSSRRSSPSRTPG